MAFSSSLCLPQVPLKISYPGRNIRCQQIKKGGPKYSFSLKSINSGLLGQQVAGVEGDLLSDWSFLGGSRITIRPKVARFTVFQKCSGVYASWLTNSQIASNIFTLGTIAVLPFYSLMVIAPEAQLTRRSMESSIPYVALGLLYAYLLHLSWTPNTIHLIFASQYWLPELSSIAKLFSSELSVASGWIHLLAVDLFAARQVFRDGLENEIETRHSVFLCLFFCPIGIITHVITKALTKGAGSTSHGV